MMRKRMKNRGLTGLFRNTGRVFLPVYIFGITLLLPAILWFPSVVQAEKPDLAVARPVISGEVSGQDLDELFTHFKSLLLKRYNLVGETDYQQASQKVFEEINIEQCTEGYCIYLIKQELDVKRLIIFELARQENFNQIKVTMVRDEDKLVQETFCRSCSMGTLKERIAERVKKMYLADVDSSEDLEPEPLSFTQKIRKDWPWHVTFTGIALISAYAGLDQVSRYNELSDENGDLEQKYSAGVTKAELEGYRSDYDANRDEMETIENNIRILNAVLAVSLVCEVHFLFFSEDDSELLSGTSRYNKMLPDKVHLTSGRNRSTLAFNWYW